MKDEDDDEVARINSAKIKIKIPAAQQSTVNISPSTVLTPRTSFSLSSQSSFAPTRSFAIDILIQLMPQNELDSWLTPLKTLQNIYSQKNYINQLKSQFAVYLQTYIKNINSKKQLLPDNIHTLQDLITQAKRGWIQAESRNYLSLFSSGRETALANGKNFKAKLAEFAAAGVQKSYIVQQQPNIFFQK